jgi:hypothetical protein
MKEQELGKEGEQQARVFLKNMGFEVQSPDWLARKNGEWICIEVKKKERFTAPPFDGHGLDTRQIYLRNQLLKEKGIRTYLMIFEVPTNLVFGEYLDILEAGKKIKTRNEIVIYPLTSFKKL